MSRQAHDEMNTQLVERDQLIAALTEQLEQAAEQLDRYQRQGAANRTSAQLVSQSNSSAGATQDVLDQLEQLNQSWDNFALSGTMGRVELQLNELRDLFFQHIVNADWKRSLPVAHEKSLEDHSPSTIEPEITSVLEAFSELYQQDEQHESDDTTDEHHAELDIEPLDEIDFETASKDDLVDALLQRDHYIRNLIRRQREIVCERILSTPTDWDAVASAPEELVCQLQELDRQLNERLRTAEVNFSIERGRLAREQAQLDQYRMQLDKQAKALGLNIQAESPAEQQDVKNGKSKSGRWRNYLGID